MIIVQLKGGLANQLFQYAAGLSLAKHHNVPVKVDTTLLQRPDDEIGTSRNYELDKIKVAPTVASLEEIAAITQQAFLKKYFQKVIAPYKRDIYKEAYFPFDPNFFSAKPHIYLKGYRQSEKYFKTIEDIVRNQFILKESLLTNVANLGVRISNQESVSIHIRRGDYTDKAVKDYHGVLDKLYYEKTVALIKSRIANPKFYAFSDNVEWVKQNLDLGAEAVFISGNYSNSHYEDFYLMSCCRHNIIANSSFSWWSAWLNNNPQKQVVAPAKWFNTNLDTKDLIPNTWIRV